MTYTITSAEHNSTTNTYDIVFTRSGDDPFDASVTTYTTSVQSSSIGQSPGYNGNFSIELADGFRIAFSWGSGSNVTFINNCISPGVSGKQITYSVSCTDDTYYFTHVKMQDVNRAWIDQGYENQWRFSQNYATAYAFGAITVTYANTPPLTFFESAGTNTYKIRNKEELRHLANYVNGGNNCSGLTFLQTQDITCDATYMPIGNSGNAFHGTYNGQGNTVSGITVSRTTDYYIGLFGRVFIGKVENVILSNSTFTGYFYVGGIVGFNNGGTVQNCRVENTVFIMAGYDKSESHGGIVGYSIGRTAKVIGCISAATVSRNGKANCNRFGGIVGKVSSGSTIKDCLYTGTSVDTNGSKGAILGYKDNSGTLTNNYYTSIDLGGVQGSDADGARRARTVTLGENVTLVGEETDYSYSGLTAIGTTALRSGTTIYSGEGQTLTLAYSNVPTGYTPTYTATSGGNDITNTAISGNTLTMPASIVTISTQLIANTYTVTFDNQGATTVGTASVTVTYEAAMPAITLPERTGYTFGGYYTAANGGTKYYNADGTSAGNWDIDGNTTLYAKWTANTYTLRLQHNDGTDDYTDQSMTYDVAANIQSITRTGYAFQNWTTNADGSGDSYTDGQSVSNLTPTNGTTMDLYAQWTANTYTVTFNNQSATTAGTLWVVATIDADMPSITVPERTDFTFDGYYTEPKGGGTKYYNADGTSARNWDIHGSTTLYAHWTLPLSGNGTKADPYVIASANDWESFADLTVNSALIGEYFRLDNDISVSKMASTNESAGFSGIFDGNGHKITLALRCDIPFTGPNEQDQGLALFRFADNGCTIHDLTVDGTITTVNKFAAGFISYITSGTASSNRKNIVLRNCRSSVCINSTVSGDATSAGFVAISKQYINLTMEHCFFDGSFVSSSATQFAGFIGWQDSNSIATISESVVAPASIALTADNGNHRTFCRFDTNYNNLSLTNSYYCTAIGTAQGTKGYPITADAQAKMTLTGETGLQFGSTIYAASGETVSLTMTDPSDAPTGYTTIGQYHATSGSLSGSGTSYTLTMPSEDVFISCFTKVIGSLSDNTDNTGIINLMFEANSADVTLAGRTLYKDGAWNTLCLPFDVSTTSGPLAGDGATAMTLDTSTSGFSNGTLTLSFTSATSIPAGTPFIIKWDNKGTTLTNPLFTGVTISTATNNATVSDVLTFTGTYSPVEIGSTGDNTKLYLGAGNTLYYPSAAMTINAFRAYFQLNNGITAADLPANGVKMFFGDETDGVKEIVNSKSSARPWSLDTSRNSKSLGAWYDMSGRQIVNRKSSNSKINKGIYIHNGKKVVIK